MTVAWTRPWRKRSQTACQTGASRSSVGTAGRAPALRVARGSARSTQRLRARWVGLFTLAPFSPHPVSAHIPFLGTAIVCSVPAIARTHPSSRVVGSEGADDHGEQRIALRSDVRATSEPWACAFGHRCEIRELSAPTNCDIGDGSCRARSVIMSTETTPYLVSRRYRRGSGQPRGA